jgi:anti-sigma regulatory factor (Ser/Thr protein kinase)
MAECLAIDDRRCRKLRISIHPAAEYRKVLAILNSLVLPGFIPNPENVKFAVLELINNSLRAHREKRVSERIQTLFRLADGELRVSIRDFGGGFDPGRLPYRLEDDPAGIDQNSRAFQEYQQKNDYQRFGMGLLVARRVFSRFSLHFLGPAGQRARWGEDPVTGTLITLSIGGA